MNRVNQGGEAAKRISQVEGKRSKGPEVRQWLRWGVSSSSALEEDANGTGEAVRAPGGLLSMGFGQGPQGNN